MTLIGLNDHTELSTTKTKNGSSDFLNISHIYKVDILSNLYLNVNTQVDQTNIILNQPIEFWLTFL